MSEDKPDNTADEFLNWLCWMWAQDGERFYPPKETAAECIENVKENYEDHYDDLKLDLKLVEAYQWEVGQHSRAYTEAVSKFRDAHDWGFSPMERAAREHRDLMERADGEVDPIDWSWLGDRDEFIDGLVKLPEDGEDGE